MAARTLSTTTRTLCALLGVASASAAFGVGCNAILGIDEGHLVTKGAGGSTSEDSGAGGSSTKPDAGASGGAASGDGGRAAGGASGAGSGGRSTGGAGAGGRGTGGAGMGGASTGGAGTGGAAGGGAGGMQEPAGVPGEVQCGTSSCKLPGQVCCIDTTSGAAHCAMSCDSTSQLPVSCDGSEDCSGGKPKCCYPTGGTAASCTAGCIGRVFCGKDSDCIPGQRCAPGAGALASVFVCKAIPSVKTVWCGSAVCDVALGEMCCYDKTAKSEQCSKTCKAADVKFACDAAEDCASGSSCCETRTGVGLITGTQCVAGGCAAAPEFTCGGANGCTSVAGSQCCLSATGSTCSATCSGEVVCGTAADCAAGQSCTPIAATGIGSATGRAVCTAP